MKFLVLLIVAIAAPATVLAHSTIGATVPADNTALVNAPEQLEFTFAKKIRLTRVTVTDADGDLVDVDLSDHKVFDTMFAFPVALEGTGAFKVEWRGLSADGHIMNGSFHFSVK
ncbi:MAG: copper resistance CopC family protein [Pseudomonadota bacterium]